MDDPAPGGPTPEGDAPTDDPLAWTTLDSSVAYACPGFDVRHEAVRLPGGTGTDYDFVDEPPAVVVLPFTPDDDVVVIEEWRQAVRRVNLGLPAGTVEPGESPAAAARRELAEETGHRAGSVERLTTVEPANGVANSVHHHFLARDCEPADGARDLDHDESIRVATASLRALRTAAREDRLRDGRAMLAVLYHGAFVRDGGE